MRTTSLLVTTVAALSGAAACDLEPQPGRPWTPVDATTAEGASTQGNAEVPGDADGTGSPTTGGGGESGSAATTSTSDGSSDGSGATTEVASESGASTDTTGATTTGTTGGPVSDRDDPTSMCARWNGDRADMSNGTSTGDTGSCTPGTLSQDGLDNTLKIINLYRWLAHQPPAYLDDALNASAQACALILAANRRLSHAPEPDWLCHTDDGATAASRSNISTISPVGTIDAYMIDHASLERMGHRRWILSNGYGRTGTGAVDGYSCLYVIAGGGTGTNEFTAWPAPGPFPIQAMERRYGGEVDGAGWTVQSTRSLAGASMRVTEGGTELPIVFRELGRSAENAIAFTPDGWSATAGKTYHIEVNGVASPFAYDVEMVDCG